MQKLFNALTSYSLIDQFKACDSKSRGRKVLSGYYEAMLVCGCIIWSQEMTNWSPTILLSFIFLQAQYLFFQLQPIGQFLDLSPYWHYFPMWILARQHSCKIIIQVNTTLHMWSYQYWLCLVKSFSFKMYLDKNIVQKI